jgi:uncharacterized YigZ family protein
MSTIEMSRCRAEQSGGFAVPAQFKSIAGADFFARQLNANGRAVDSCPADRHRGIRGEHASISHDQVSRRSVFVSQYVFNNAGIAVARLHRHPNLITGVHQILLPVAEAAINECTPWSDALVEPWRNPGYSIALGIVNFGEHSDSALGQATCSRRALPRRRIHFMERAFRTLRGPGQSELEIKRSRFLGRAEPVRDEAAFADLIAAIRATHPDASHHAFAYRLGRSGEIARFSDAGEPGGTAGRPMMEVLIREEVVDAAIVVSRYFGGTLLGTGGLTRSYGQAAAGAVRSAGYATMSPHTEMLVTIDYGHFGAMEQALKRADLAAGQTTYSDVVSLMVQVPAGEEAAFGSLIADLTAGAGLVEAGKTVFLPDRGA